MTQKFIWVLSRYLSTDTNMLIQRGTSTPMFVAAQSTIAKVWKEPKCPTDEWIKKNIYILEYYLAIKKNEMLTFATTWMELEFIMVGKISQRKTNIILFNSYMEFKKQNR